MELTKIFYPGEAEDSPEGLVTANWTPCLTSQIDFGFRKNLPASFSHSTIYHAGVRIENGRVMNPEDLVEIHTLASQFMMYKYCRAVYFKSSVFLEDS